MFESILKEPESRQVWLEYMFRFLGNKTNANENFKIWSGANHPEAIYKADFLMLKLNYIHENPVRAGIVAKSFQYLYSSAGIYAGEKNGILEIDLLYYFFYWPVVSAQPK